MLTSFEIFSGIGGASLGMKDAGYTSLGSVDINEKAVEIHDLNHETPSIVDDVLNIESIPHVNLLWMSPSCQSFSLANTSNRGEKDLDIKIAKKLATLIKGSNPDSIIIENVPSYKNSESYKILQIAIISAGYAMVDQIVDSRNHGCATSRKRLVSSAKKGSVYSIPSDIEKPVMWEQVLNGLMLPIMPLTKNQYNGIDDLASIPDIFVIERCGYYRTPKVWTTDQYFPTIKAATHHDGKGSYRVAFNIVSHGISMALTPQALGVIQGFPVDYIWGTEGMRAEAARGIGNSVCPPVAKAAALNLLRQIS